MSFCVGVASQGSNDPEGRLVDCTAYALGRQGAFRIRIVDSEADLAQFRTEAAALASAIVYDHGKTYEDFAAQTDKVARYDLTGLASGGFAHDEAAPKADAVRKTTIWVYLGLLLLKLWKLLLIGLAVIGSIVRWVRSRMQKTGAQPAKVPAAKPNHGTSAAAGAAAFIGGQIEALRSKLPGFAKGGAPVAATANAAAREEIRAVESVKRPAAAATSESALARFAASLRSRFSKDGEKAPTGNAAFASAGGAVVNPVESSASSLSRLARMMRKEDAEMTDGEAAAPRRRLSGAEFDEAANAQRKRDLPGAAPVYGAAGMRVSSDFDLVEPGDQAAASAAISARKALREATA